MEVLKLPSPASELLEATSGVLDELIRPVTPGGTIGRLGGGTTLAARWGHRRSTDIDIAVPVGTSLARYDPARDSRLVEGMAAQGATHADLRFRHFTFTFPTGKLDLVEMDPQPRIGHATAEVDGKRMEVYSNAQILCGELAGRDNLLPERDIFDLAIAERFDPPAFSAAVNYLETDYRREVVYRVRAQADHYRKNARTVIDITDPQWNDLLSIAPEAAADAIEAAAYGQITLAYGEAGIMLQLSHDNSGAPIETLTFDSGAALVNAIPTLGLEPCFLQVLGSVDAVERHVDQRLASWRQGDRRAELSDPPYRIPRTPDAG